MNDIMVLGGGGNGFCDVSIKAIILESVTMEGGDQK